MQKPKYEYEVRVEGKREGRAYGNIPLSLAPKYNSAKPIAETIAEFDKENEDFEGFITIKRAKVGG